MRKNTVVKPGAVGESERQAASSPTSTMTVSTPPVPVALLELAEELGRLIARELARPGRRRGHSLPELVFGAAVTALIWVLVARVFGLVPH